MSGRYALPCPRMQFLSPRIKHRRSICSKPVSLPRWGPLRGAWGLRRVQEGRGPKLAGCIESGSKLLLRCCGKSWKKIPWKSCCLPPRRNHRFTWPVPSPAACRQFPGCGNIVTFSQFLFIAVEGFIFEANFGRKRPAIPMRYYLIMVAMFFTVSVVNNYALNLNIAMPLHMIFRSGSLIASMALGIIILKKRYSMSKYTSIALVSVGIFTCTFMSAKQVASDSGLNEEDGLHVFLWWLLGIAALTFALLMSARMGIFQETLYKRFGKHSKEALFYNHALPLPGFLLLAPNIYHHAVLFSQSEPFQIPVIGLTLPIMWFYLLMNVITQYVCIRGVFILTTECTSLTVTLVVTLRKFVSLIFSILYFRNPFTAWHWLGTAFVFVGTLMYTEVWNSLGPLLARWRKRPKEE